MRSRRQSGIQSVHRVLACCIGSAMLAVGATGATPPALTVFQLANLCASSTVAEAAAKGDRLGWQPASDARLKAWRDAFLAYNGGPVHVLGWQRGEEDEEFLAFWIARGPNGHRACAYTVANPAGVLEALSEYFGSPGSFERYDFGAAAFWRSGRAEISFTQVGSQAAVNIVRED